jgi:hypothetical protein
MLIICASVTKSEEDPTDMLDNELGIQQLHSAGMLKGQAPHLLALHRPNYTWIGWALLECTGGRFGNAVPCRTS